VSDSGFYTLVTRDLFAMKYDTRLCLLFELSRRRRCLSLLRQSPGGRNARSWSEVSLTRNDYYHFKDRIDFDVPVCGSVRSTTKRLE
jgi:hypothetical protein